MVKNNFIDFLQGLGIRRYVDHKEKLKEHILKTKYMVERYKRVGIDYYFDDTATLKSVGEKYKVTRERVRQITSKFAKIIRHPEHLSYLIASVDEKYAKMLAERDSLQYRLNAVITALCNYRGLTAITNPEGRIDQSLTDCEFSIRTQNCLDSAGIRTVIDLCSYNKVELLQIRNLGKKSLIEIMDVLGRMALNLRD